MWSQWSRRRALGAGLLVPAAGVIAPAAMAQAPVELGPAEPFSFERLIVQAKEMAQRPYERRPAAPQWLSDLSPEQYRGIRYRPDRAMPLGGSPFSVQLFHLGSYHRNPVRVSLVEEGNARQVLYDPAMFDFGAVEVPEPLAPDSGFAGFRVHYVFAEGEAPQELLTFLGASYFRAVARNTRFGISARGLALETGLGRAEEFPVFTDFWILRPNDPRDPLQICALLDSPSVAGAYRFDVAPRDATVVLVDASLFFRAEVTQVGIAPLTSMYFYGANDRQGVDDGRGEVHDSDGLSIWRATGEALWRPLANPRDLRVSVFADDNPRGFGLLQRGRDYHAYGDLEARFERRPNLWVEPKGAWGIGSVRLIEIPIQDETHDNIVAFWTPQAPITAGHELRVAYSLLWSLQPPLETGLLPVLATRIGQGGEPGGDRPADLRRVSIEFGPAGPATAPDALPDTVVECHNGECTPALLRSNDVTGGFQVTFDVRLGGDAVELRCFLAREGKAVSETWLYRLDNT
jgi:periplasmic glucans biosynthesis protein